METGRYCCPRCAEGFDAAAHHSAKKPSAHAEKPARPTLRVATWDDAGESPGLDAPGFDGWEFEEQLRHVERLLAGHGKTALNRQLRLDGSHTSRTDAAPTWQRWQEQRRQRRSRRGLPLAGALLVLGLLAFLGGGALVGWSFWSGQREFWNLGLPIALLGQLALLSGLVWRLERMWADSRATVSKLEHVDDELHDLKSATHLLGSQQSPSSNNFYAHLAGGAHPQLLLADLKSQLDLLAVKLGQGEGR